MLIDKILNLGLPIENIQISYHPKAVDFLVTSLPDYPNVHIRMEPDNHPPHLHVSVGNRAHCASFALDGTFLTGNLERKQMAYVQEWICHHSRKLLRLWEIVKRGEDYSRARSDILWGDFKFDGAMPPHCKTIDDVRIWYCGSVTERDTVSTDGIREFGCSGDVHVGYPSKAKKQRFRFISLDGSPIQERIFGAR